jgi:beta-lactamase class A
MRVTRRQVLVAAGACSAGLLSTRAAGARLVDADVAAGQAVDSLLFGEDGVFGVVIMSPDGQSLVSRNSHAPFISASLYKLLVMLDYFVSRAEGTIDFSQTIELSDAFFPMGEFEDDPYWGIGTMWNQVPVIDLITTMIQYTSNVAARALLSQTTPERLSQVAIAHDMPSTAILCDPSTIGQWPPLMGDGDTPSDMEAAMRFVIASSADGPVNVTTPRDIASFFRQLASGTLIDPATSSQITEILLGQQINDRIPALLPAGTPVAHKTGNLDWVCHDAGILWGQRGTTITVLMAQDFADDQRVTQILQRLGLIAYGSLDVPPL